jgi:type I restriction enzyme, S subunit
MTLPRYGAYKDSSVAWLGEVPAHWRVTRLRHLFVIKKRIAGELGHPVLSITQAGIKIKDIESNDGQLSMDYSKYQLVEVGDFAMNHMDLLTGYVDVSRHYGVTSPDYRVFTVRQRWRSDANYLLYLFQHGYRQKIFYAFGQGASEFGRWRFPTEQFNNFSFPDPPLEEQAAIANFLNRELGVIDALIEEQEKLIVLLSDKRQATISHAVTRGINPRARMKDSGVSWLGEVPAHWEVQRLKQVVSAGVSISYGIVQPGEPLDGGVPFVQTSNMAEGKFELEHLQRTTMAIADAYPRSRLIGGEVILGIRASIGAAHVVPEHLAGANLSRGVARIECSEEITPEYLVFVLRSAATSNYWGLHKQGSTFNEVSIATVRELSFMLPPKLEQRQIAKFLKVELSTLDSLNNKAQRAIALLKERRAALVTAAVTGQIDVRGAVSLPDEALSALAA